METFGRLLATNAHELLVAISYCFFCSYKSWLIDIDFACGDFVCQIITDGVGQYEITICQSLHEGRCTQTVGTVVREVGFSDGIQTRHGGHEVIIDPQSAHGVVHRWIDFHGCFIRIVARNLLVHFEKVTIARTDYIFAHAVDGISEIEEYRQTSWGHATTFVAHIFSSTRGHVARYEVTKGWVFALEVIIAGVFWQISCYLFALLDGFGICFVLRYPHTSVVSQRL